MGKITGVLMFIITIGSVLLFVGQKMLFGSVLWWFPEGISEYAPSNRQRSSYERCGWSALSFTAAQVALGYAVIKFGRKGDARAVYTHGSNKLEAVWTIITAAVFVILAILGQRVWAQLHLICGRRRRDENSCLCAAVSMEFPLPGC